MSVGVLFVGTMLVCCLGLITGGSEDEEQKRYVVDFHLRTCIIFVRMLPFIMD